ncbi:MAG: hypothetical protein WD118_03890 [Phycisphaeraceae bacterium]
MLAWLERKFGRYAIPNLTLILIGFQVFFYLAALGNEALFEQMVLVWDRVFAGEVWRVVTFVLMPRFEHPLWFVIAMFVFWIMGSALDREWGHFRYNLYLLVGFVVTAVAGLLNPAAEVTNYYVYFSVLFAFAWLYPEIVFHLFMVIPVKVKWIGVVVAVIVIGRLIALLTAGAWQPAAVVAAGVVNFFLFFGAEIVRKARLSQRRKAHEAQAADRAAEPFHKCVVCGRSDKSDPALEFRYCPQCKGAPCYCMDHIFNHEHR